MPLLRLVALLLALAIFVVDTLTPLEGAVAVLYVTVVLIAARTARRTDIVVAAGSTIFLTLLAYIETHGLRQVGSPTLRALVSLSAIGITALLALQNQAATVALVRSERRYRRMFDASRIGVVQADWTGIRAALDALGSLDGADLALRIARDQDLVGRTRRMAKIVGANPAMLAMLDRGDAACVDDVLVAGDRTFAEALAAFAQGAPFHEGETELLRRDGRRVPVLFAITFPAAEDADGTVLVFIVDITERRQSHDALLAAQAELAHAARVATLGEISASIAHEVNQPLMAVVTNAEAGLRWLRRAPPDLQEVEQAVSRIVAQGHRASQIVARIMSFAKKSPAQQDRLAIAAIVEDAVMLVERELSREQIDLSLDIVPDLPDIVGDRVQLQQILVNLMVNACQAMAAQAGPRRLAVSAKPVGPQALAIEVSDTGRGIAPENLARLFEPFFTTKRQGLGMGLAICRTTAEAHGGRLAVENRPGEGATFRLTLPVAGAEGLAR